LGTERKARALRFFSEVSTPPFTVEGKREAFRLLRLLQLGENIGLPTSRPMQIIGNRCHELRMQDAKHNWRIVYHLAPDAVLILGVFPKKTQKTPKNQIDTCKERLKRYLDEIKKAKS